MTVEPLIGNFRYLHSVNSYPRAVSLKIGTIVQI